MESLKIILPGSIRSKKNSKIAVSVGGVHKPRRSIIIPSKAYQKWEKEARIWVKFNLPIGFKIFTEKLHVKAIFYYSGKRPDLSGSMESVGDSLEGIVYLNDGQIESWDGSRLIWDKKTPRTEVEIKRYEENLDGGGGE